MVTLLETPTRLVVTGTEEELGFLREKLRFHPADYWRSDAYQLWKVSGGKKGWDGYNYPLALKTPSAGEILRGRKDEIIDLCLEHGFRTDRTKLLESPFPSITVAEVTDDLIVSQFKLDDNQKQAVVEWLKHGIGVANMAVNAGKTASFATAAAMVKKSYPQARFLYFTPSERLVNQAVQSMREMLPSWGISQFGGGGKRDKDGKDMVVATLSMLHRHYNKLLHEGFFKTFHALLIDECHHAPAPSAERIIKSCSGFFRMGASDTTLKDDAVRWNKLQGLCGPVRCAVTSSELIQAGRSAPPHLYLVDIPQWKGRYREATKEAEIGSVAWTLIDDQWVKATYEGPVYQLDANGDIKVKLVSELHEDEWVKVRKKLTVPLVHQLRLPDSTLYEAPARMTLLDRRYDKAIIRFKERNQLICEWAKYYSDKRWNTVVVATRSTHVVVLEALLAPLLPGLVRSLDGEDSSKKRNDYFAWFKHTPGAILITPLIKEGISINEIRAGVIADPIASWELAKQIIGRFMRKKERDNVCHVTWFCDCQHPRYTKNFRDVLEKLEKIEGFTFYHPVAGPESIKYATVYKGKL